MKISEGAIFCYVQNENEINYCVKVKQLSES